MKSILAVGAKVLGVSIGLMIWWSPMLTSAQDLSRQPTTLPGAVSHTYKAVGEVQLMLHVFNPVGPVPRTGWPAIVFFFGGGWTHGSIHQFVPHAQHLAQRGMVAIVADYRVFSRHGTSPFEAIGDAKSAVRWIRAHSTDLKIDAARLAAGGGSAGGHIALAAAVIDQFDETTEDARVSSKPNALVLFNPVVDTSPDSGAATGSDSAIVRARFAERGRDASPLHHLDSDLAPTLILHGKSDRSVPYSDVEQFCRQARRLGARCDVIGYQGAAHGFFNGKWYRDTLLAADRFLTDIGYLQGPVPLQPR
jgi:acetyl esterase/lipase